MRWASGVRTAMDARACAAAAYWFVSLHVSGALPKKLPAGIASVHVRLAQPAQTSTADA